LWTQFATECCSYISAKGCGYFLSPTIHRVNPHGTRKFGHGMPRVKPSSISPQHLLFPSSESRESFAVSGSEGGCDDRASSTPTQEQRQAAYQAAREATLRAIGSKPIREHFNGETISSYPVSVTRLITLLCLIVPLAAFTPSAIRLYVIGSQTFGPTVPNPTAENAVGLATVLSAEIGQVVFSLVLATLGTSSSTRRLLYASMGIVAASR
jgi:hypothetical protein